MQTLATVIPVLILLRIWRGEYITEITRPHSMPHAHRTERKGRWPVTRRGSSHRFIQQLFPSPIRKTLQFSWVWFRFPAAHCGTDSRRIFNLHSFKCRFPNRKQLKPVACAKNFNFRWSRWCFTTPLHVARVNTPRRFLPVVGFQQAPKTECFFKQADYFCERTFARFVLLTISRHLWFYCLTNSQNSSISWTLSSLNYILVLSTLFQLQTTFFYRLLFNCPEECT